MATTGILALIFVVILTFAQSTEGANITTAPVSVTTGPFKTAEFICEGTGDRLTWFVQSAPLNDAAVKQLRDITVTDGSSGNNLSSVLAITALPINDGIGIGCQIISFNPYSEVFSSESTLTIRGISSVENFTLLRRNGYSEANWSPPAFHSNDIAGGVVFTYEVTVTNEEGILIIREAVSNTFVALNVTECDAFNISVTAFGGLYSSTFTWNSGSCSVDIEKVRLMLQENGLRTCNVFFGLKGTPNVCEGKILVNVTRLSDENTTVNEIVVNASLESYELIGHDITDLEPFERYSITAVILNPTDCPKDQESTTISTYNVQGINVSSPYINGSVSVKCLFIDEESIANGCHVVFRDTAQGINESFNITGSAEIVSPSVSGNYTVTAYDLVNGTIIGPAVEHPLPVVVHVVAIMPTPSSSMSIDSDINTYTDIISSTASFFVTSPAMHVPMSPSETSDTHQIGIIIGGALGAAGVFACCCKCPFIIALVVVLVIGRQRKKRRPEEACSDGGKELVSKKTKETSFVRQTSSSPPTESNDTCITMMPAPPEKSSIEDKDVFQNGFDSTAKESNLYTTDPHRCGNIKPEFGAVTIGKRQLASAPKQGTMRGNEEHDIEM